MQFARYVFCVPGIQIWLDGKFNNKLPFNGKIVEPNGGLSTPWLIAEGTGAPHRCHESLNGCLHLDVGQMIGTLKVAGSISENLPYIISNVNRISDQFATQNTRERC